MRAAPVIATAALAAGLAALAPGRASAAPTYSFVNFDVPTSTNTFAFGINNAGQIVGSSTPSPDTPDRGYLRDPASGSLHHPDRPGRNGRDPRLGHQRCRADRRGLQS